VNNVIRELISVGYPINIDSGDVEGFCKRFAVTLDTIILDTVYYYASHKLVYEFVNMIQAGQLAEHLHIKNSYIEYILSDDRNIGYNAHPEVVEDAFFIVKKYIKRLCNSIEDSDIDTFSMNILGVCTDFYDQTLGINPSSYYFSILSWDKPMLSGVFKV
jgi:hypothetical protein